MVDSLSWSPLRIQGLNIKEQQDFSPTQQAALKTRNRTILRKTSFLERA